jgi:heme O synthase-like polyprenyltransferase
VLVATSVGCLPGAIGVQCGWSAMTSVSTTHERNGPIGTSAENGYRLSGAIVTVTHSRYWACSTVTPFIYRAAGAPRLLRRDSKRLAFWRRHSDAKCVQKRARPARRNGQGRRAIFLKRLSLVLVATSVGCLPGAIGVQCGWSAMTSVSTTHERNGPIGTSAENG